MTMLQLQEGKKFCYTKRMTMYRSLGLLGGLVLMILLLMEKQMNVDLIFCPVCRWNSYIVINIVLQKLAERNGHDNISGL